MLFQVYGANAPYQWLGWILVFACLIGLNEVARRSKTGGIICFLAIPAALTAYFLTIYVSAAFGADWALHNPTYVHMTSWFHYAKLYAATAGCRKDGVAGLINIFCMTGIFGIYASKDRRDMLWPDMTWVFIISYDLWNFCYTYNCLPNHAWYCGLALLLAPTFANFLWNKGGWIQNRANTLAIWCMFAQVLPMFQDYSVFSTQSVNKAGVNLTVSILSLAANVLALGYILVRARRQHINPWTREVFKGTRDFDQAITRADMNVVTAA